MVDLDVTRPGPRGDFPRMLADLKRLARIGADGRGVTRPAFSPLDLTARRWLVERFEAAGLEASIDGIGNAMGRDRTARRTLLLGSHTDTVPRGGWLDGALGVVFALEAARAWRTFRPDASVGIDVISFADEEGTVDACVGSRAFCGLWNGLTTGEETPLSRALTAAGLSGTPGHRIDPSRHQAYGEAHIEQGPRLEAGGYAIGLVEGIVGVRRQRVRFTGRADHAGTTPMADRQDAGQALFAFCTGLDTAFRETAPADAVWNMGVVHVAPGAANVVPSAAEVIVEYRHLTPSVLADMTSLVHAIAARSAVPAVVEQGGALEPSAMDPTLTADLAAAAEAAGLPALRMGSGAGHDAMITARVMPSAMMFLPSIGGRSHDPAEDTSETDLARGLTVYIAWVWRVLSRLDTAPHALR